jgi:hypothetical protein
MHDNMTIHDLIRAEKAMYCCEVLCPGTLYREVFHSKDLKFDFEIPRTTIRNKVDFQAYCVAKSEITNYINSNLHSDYEGFSFDLAKADLLAIFGTFNFNADIQYQKLKAASSFMQIVPNDPGKSYTEYILDDSKIQIKLPEVLYEKYKLIGGKKDLAPIIHASLVQNALIIALFNLQEHIARGNIWALSIQHRLENELDLNEGSTQIDVLKVPALVQKLLGNPNERLINSLEQISIKDLIQEN